MRALADLDVLIVDCQTTGASPAFGSVLELGWGIARAKDSEIRALQAHWIALPEGRMVPQQVRKLTGYDPENVVDAIAESEAWRRLRGTLSSASAVPTAIHYARYELAFLRDWSARLEPEAPFPIDAVCVHGIATRLYPELPRQSLRALSGFLGHGLNLSRRSLGHVEATAFVWRKLCVGLAAREINTWEQLQGWLGERAPTKTRAKKPTYPILPERYKALPDEPGVYRFLRSNGDVLYVGKATSLKKRTASHFAARGGTPQSPEMLTQVSDIQVSVAASALEAALLENETIKTLRPPYNVQLTPTDPRVWYSSPAFEGAASAPDEHHSIGPLPSEYSLRPLAALIALTSGAVSGEAIRSSAVGVSALWTPEQDVFREGWAEFALRHSAMLNAARGPRLAVLQLARQLLLDRALLKSEEEPEGVAVSGPKQRTWDPERVARHLERAAAQAYQSYRRARWLRLLHDSDIVYREPTSARTRRLLIRGGALHEAKDDVFEPPSMPARPSEHPVFDRAKYDRLRILTTELKRIQRDGGAVALHRSSDRRVSSALLRGILLVV